MAKNKIIQQIEEDFFKNAKIYRLVDGECITCTLAYNCKKDKKQVREFLKSLGIVCEDGKNIQVRVK